MVCTSIFLPLFAGVVTWLIYNQVQASNTETITRSLCFTIENQTSLLPFVPKRLTPSGLNGVATLLKCAFHTLLAFPESRGFLYNSLTGLCSPLLWLEGPSAQGAQSVQPHEGDMYLSCGLCGGQFDIMEVGDTGELVCLKYVNTAQVSYGEAASHCAALGAYLVSVKTVAKLELLQRIVAGYTWVGVEYSTSKGSLIWSKDEEIVTAQQVTNVFVPGEPNCISNNENCGCFDFSRQALNDQVCDVAYHYICEKDLPILVG